MTVLTAVILGLVTGIVLGFVLEKSRAFEPGMVIGQMQLRNFILVKVWFSAIATALVAVTLLQACGLVTLHPKPFLIAADLAGGLLVGAGMTLAGGSPAMVMAQIGAGYRDAWFTVLGGLCGACTFYALEPVLHPLLEGRAGAVTLVDLTTMPFPALGVAIAVALFACIMALERLRPWRVDLGLQGDGITSTRLRLPPGPVADPYGQDAPAPHGGLVPPHAD